jgi:hypothetical protein
MNILLSAMGKLPIEFTARISGERQYNLANAISQDYISGQETTA